MKSLQRLWQIMGRRRLSYVLALLAATTVKAVMEIVLAGGLKNLVNAAASRNVSLLIRTTGFFFGALAVIAVLFPLTRIWFESLVAEISRTLRTKVFNHILSLPVSYFDKSSSGDVLSRMSNDLRVIEAAYGNSIFNLAETFAWSVAAMVYMFYLSWQMGLVVASFGILVVCLNAVLSRKQHVISQKVQEAHSQFLAHVHDLLAGLETLKVDGLQKHFFSLSQTVSQRLLKHILDRAAHSGVISAANELASQLNFVGVVGFGAYLVSTGKIEVGIVIAALQLYHGATRLFFELGGLITRWQTALAGAERVLAILDQQVEQVAAIEGEYSIPAEVTVEFRSVSFAYDPNRPALRNVSFAVQPGQTVALVGPSGAGKSTIFNLLLGFYEPDEGSILINGRDTTQVSKGFLRQLISYVPQENIFFSGTVAENVACGTTVDDNVIISALEAAQAYSFVKKLDRGIHTRMGSEGVDFSEGEKQRLAIARALVRNAPLVLLDEATSALDALSEDLVQRALQEIFREKTVLVIAHRLWTVQNADLILVIKDGEVVEQGTHRELLAKGGLYKELVEKSHSGKLVVQPA